MSKTYEMLLAGFGGQGILFSAKTVVYAGMKNGNEVSWIPSYGPEMRGGTCNCSVVVSKEQVGCPIVTTPNVLVAMNLPSLEKFIDSVVSGGLVIIDSSLITAEIKRKDVKVVSVPATKLANENGFTGLANMILVGKLIKETEYVSYDDFVKSLEESIPASKGDLLANNLKAVEMGYSL